MAPGMFPIIDQQNLPMQVPGQSMPQGPPPPGKEQFHNTIADMSHRAEANRAEMIGLDPSDPDYTKKLSALQAQHGAITTEKARFQMLHPWGGPEPGTGQMEMRPKTGSASGPSPFDEEQAPDMTGKMPSAGGMPEVGNAPMQVPQYGGPGKPVEQGQMIPDKQLPKDEFKYQQGMLRDKVMASEGDPDSWAEAKGELARNKMDNPWGSPGNHPGMLGKIGHDLGNFMGAFSPQAELQAEERGDRAARTHEAEIGQKEAQTKLATAQAANAGVGKTDPEVVLHDLMTGDNGNPRVNPETNKPYTYLEAYDATSKVGQEVKNPPLQNADQLNKMMTSRYQVLHPGATLPEQYTLPPNATKADYDRIDKGLEQEEKASGTAAQQQTLNEMRQEAHQLAEQNSQFEHQRQTEGDQDKRDRQTQQDYDKNVAPIQGDIAYIDAYRQGKHTGPGDEALMEKFFDLAKPSTGFRMSQPQINMLTTARSWMEGTKALAYHALTGTWFSDEQRQQIMDTMHQLADGKMKALQGGPRGQQRAAEGGGEAQPASAGGPRVSVADWLKSRQQKAAPGAP